MNRSYLKSKVYSLASTSFCSELFWRATAKSLRILAYHGIRRDYGCVGGLPKYFVKQSAFEDQLRYLSRNATVLKLSEAVRLLNNAELPDRAICITFDDGYANNLELAVPLLERYGLPATVFVATAYVQSGDFFPFDKARLLQHFLNTKRNLLEAYRALPLDRFVDECLQDWDKVKNRISDRQKAALRPLSVQEIQQFPAQLVSIGAHSHTHCTFGHESRPRRAHEITRSLELVRQWTGKPASCFSFPNGEPGDFDEKDKSLLRDLQVSVAVTGIPGRNHQGAEPLELRRYPIGTNSIDEFISRVAGVRDCIKSFSSINKRRLVAQGV